MKKHKQNMFNEKFRLLNTQGSTEEINWSSSDSNEYENVPSNIERKNCNVAHKNRKRKRKQKGARNISNLNITFVDKSIENKVEFDTKVCVQETCKYPEQTSPILYTSQYFPPHKRKDFPSSPILLNSVKESHPNEKKSLKSPIIVLKTASPKVSPKVRKKLFNSASQTIDKHSHTLQNRSKSSYDCLERRKSDNNQLDDFKCLNLTNKVLQHNDVMKINLHEDDQGTINNDKNKLSAQSSFINKIEVNNMKQELKEDFDINCTIQETPDAISVDDSMVMLKTSSTDLAKKVKSYFDSHFSSDSASQLTISEVETPKSISKTSDDIEIISTITQMPSNRNSAESVPEPEPEELNKKEKKLRYKKDGLAYRLNSLLKKQTANISLWQHERFLAANSNFVIPKGEFRAFRICKIQFNYGSYLLEAVDANEDNFLILINKTYVSHDKIREESFFKLYEPYKVMDFQKKIKLIINVCKFEFVEADC